jgi:thiol-disulfide isomerase/thioredoxin
MTVPRRSPRTLLRRRILFVAGATLAAAFLPRKLLAQEKLEPAELSALIPPKEPPEISFVDAEGTPHALAEFKGHGVVINLWATWCVPCVAELPSLDALAAELAPNDIGVLPLSSDRGGAKVVQAFYRDHHITRLPVLLDPKGAAAHAFAVKGIPTTIIINRDGRIVSRLDGGADWNGAAKRIRELVG